MKQVGRVVHTLDDDGGRFGDIAIKTSQGRHPSGSHLKPRRSRCFTLHGLRGRYQVRLVHFGANTLVIHAYSPHVSRPAHGTKARITVCVMTGHGKLATAIIA